MPARTSTTDLPAAVSVTEMARKLGLSRSRFYELVRTGHFPMPVYCTRTRRPMYLTEQMVECLKAKQSGIGVNGGYVLFYSPRQESQDVRPSRSVRITESLPTPHAEIVDGLRALGMTAPPAEVTAAVRVCYPDGIVGRDGGEVLRAVWQQIRRSNVG